MLVLVDTCIWSEALRRKKIYNFEIVNNLKSLIDNNLAVITGSIRQEILSGIKDTKQFIELKRNLAFFRDLIPETKTHEYAAQIFNECKANGIQGSSIDFLICALSIEHKIPIFTTDKDFMRYKKVVNIELY